MALTRTSLRAFLVNAKSALQRAIRQQENVTLVIGNESADLDSLTSSLLYAYIRTLTHSLHIPLTNIPRSSLALRPEFTTLLRHANLSPDHLITLSDLPDLPPIATHLAPDHTTWTLVDHNALQGPLGQIYAHRVRGVIDHHDDEHAVPLDTGDNPRIITQAGSCTSLVTNYVRAAWDALAAIAPSSGAGHGQDEASTGADGAAVARVWDAQVARLAIASILVDTRNLTDASKTTEADRTAVEFLEAKILAASPVASTTQGGGDRAVPKEKWDREAFFREIDEAKRDVEGLALADILRKDYKEWKEGGRKLGISSVVKPLSFLRSKAGHELEGEDRNQQDADTDAFVKATDSFASDRDLSIYAFMTAFTVSDGDFQRELLVSVFDEEGRAAVAKFERTAAEELGLEEMPEDGETLQGHENGQVDVHLWRQGNVGASRKRVAPLLRQAMG